MIRPPPRATLTATLFPYTPLFRLRQGPAAIGGGAQRDAIRRPAHARAPAAFPPLPRGKAEVGDHRPTAAIALEPRAGAQPPAVDAPAQRPEEALVRVARRPFGEGADGIAAAARGAVGAGNAVGKKINLTGPANRAPPVGATTPRNRA